MLEADAARIRANLQTVRERIRAACDRSSRNPDDVSLIAVTKTVGIDEIRCLYDAGVRDFGENRVKPACEKVELLRDTDIRWHFVGHLQRNKARKIIPAFLRFHGVESLKLVDVLEREAEKSNSKLTVWVEVNVSGEESKYGIAPADLPELSSAVESARHLTFAGLMTMAPWTEDPDRDARPVFRGLRELGETTQRDMGLTSCGLSMGMSVDYEVAVEEGATHVRVGSALFE